MHIPGSNPWGLLIQIVLAFQLTSPLVVASPSNEKILGDEVTIGKHYARGELMPVSCLNRTTETGEHIEDPHGNLQYIPFPTCDETKLPLAFPYATPTTLTCTIASLDDDLYHLLEFFVHSDVPLTCRVPSYPLLQRTATVHTYEPSAKIDGTGLANVGSAGSEPWNPLTIALQGSLQRSHLHLHTTVNVLFHTSADSDGTPSHLIAAAAYSLPNLTNPLLPLEGTKVVRTEPLTFTFEVGWIDGAVLPGMASRPVIGIRDHGLGFSLLTFFALTASAGLGAMAMMIWERRKSGRSFNGLLPTVASTRGMGMGGGGSGNGHPGYGGYGGYGGFGGGPGLGKKD